MDFVFCGWLEKLILLNGF
uniref:Uncharacterized protein n=1 Tax=Rhizophora mucronata TaxID=61149 RepID=A0A2P2NPK4_RHIMU